MHPIFSSMSKEGAKLIIQECCEIMFLRKLEIVFNEGECQQNIYIPLYGKLRLWSRQKGIICRGVGMGQTIGEECLCDSVFLHRTEKCFTETEAALLCIDR